MRILLTGSKGFIGKNLVELLGDKYEFIEVTRDTEFDISDINSLLKINNIDVVIHTAAKTFVPDSFIQPYDFYKFNINSSLNIAEYCRIKKISKLIYLNAYPYGKPDCCPINEDHNISLHSPYNQSKHLSELVITNYLETITDVVSLRLFNLYGKHQRNDFVVPHIIKQALKSNSVTVKDLDPKRDYLYIKDLVSLIDLIINTKSVVGSFNVGSAESYSVRDIINLVSSILGKQLNIKSLGVRRDNEVMDCYADISKLTKNFGWTPKYLFRDGLADYIDKFE